MRKVFVGVDVAKDKLDISISLDGFKYDTLQILNKEGSILDFFIYLKNTYKKSDFYFGYEAMSNITFLSWYISTRFFPEILTSELI